MRKLIFFLFLLASSQVIGQQQSNLELLDIFNYEYVSDPQISPDGSKIIYVRNFKDVMTDRNLSNLWIVNFDGSNNRPLTTGNNNDFSPVWSHDGTRILYKSNQHDKKVKVYLMWLDTKESFALTNTPIAPRDLAWSPDDKMIACRMFVPGNSNSIVKMPAAPKGAKWNTPPTYIDKLDYRRDGEGYVNPGYAHIFLLSTDGGMPVQLTQGEKDYGAPVWSHDGKQLYFSADLADKKESDPSNNEIHAVDIKSGKVKTLTDRFGPDRSPAISPDGSTIAYLSYDDKDFLGYNVADIYTMNTDGSNKRALTDKFDRNVESMTWSNDGKSIYFSYTDNGDGKIGKVTMDGKVETVIGMLGGLSLGRPYNSASFSMSKNNRIAYTAGGPDHPADLGTYVNGKTNRLTYVNDDLFLARKIGKVEEVRWKSSYDQQDIQGWMVTPPDFDPSKKYPFILEIHGGPFASYGNVYSAEVQAFAAAGYVVLYCNPRGSSGYGKDFGNLIHHDYPNHDYEDLMSGVDAVIAKGFIDTKQLFVTGGSGGGVLTSWIIGKTDRFAAAVVAKPVINWYSFVLYADGANFFSKYWFPNLPWEDPEPYLRRSPLSYVGNIKTPTMLLTGEEDYRTPIAESEQLYAALKLQDVEASMVRIPGASHGIAARPSNLIAKIAAILAWFDKYKEE